MTLATLANALTSTGVAPLLDDSAMVEEMCSSLLRMLCAASADTRCMAAAAVLNLVLALRPTEGHADVPPDALVQLACSLLERLEAGDTHSETTRRLLLALGIAVRASPSVAELIGELNGAAALEALAASNVHNLGALAVEVRGALAN